MQREVRFYCANSNPYQVFYLGRQILKLPANCKTILPAHLQDEVFSALQKALELSDAPFIRSEQRSIHVYAVRNEEGKPVVYCFGSSVEPRVVVTNHEIVNGEHTWRMSLCSEIAQCEEQVASYVNAFLSVHSGKIDDGHYLLLHFSQDAPHLPVLLVASIISVNGVSASQRKLMKECPQDRILVEVGIYAKGLFCFVKKEAWENRKVTAADVMVSH